MDLYDLTIEDRDEIFELAEIYGWKLPEILTATKTAFTRMYVFVCFLFCSCFWRNWIFDLLDRFNQEHWEMRKGPSKTVQSTQKETPVPKTIKKKQTTAEKPAATSTTKRKAKASSPYFFLRKKSKRKN